jgi:hypothetical protein
MIFYCGSVYFGQQVQKTMFIFFQSRFLAKPLATSRGTLGFRGTRVEKPCSKISEERAVSIFRFELIEAVCSSKTLVSAYKSTRRDDPEDQIRQENPCLCWDRTVRQTIFSD